MRTLTILLGLLLLPYSVQAINQDDIVLKPCSLWMEWDDGSPVTDRQLMMLCRIYGIELPELNKDTYSYPITEIREYLRHVVLVPLGGDIQDYVDAADSGTILQLEPGVYIIEEMLNLDKIKGVCGGSKP